VCECGRDDFARFYDGLVPGLKQVAAGSDSDLSRAAMLCIATVAECVGKVRSLTVPFKRSDVACVKERFALDATDMIGMFLQRRQAVPSVSNKEQVEDLDGFFGFVSRVSTVLQSGFMPFVPHVLPLLLQAAQVRFAE